MMNEVSTVVIAGGGTAGWMAAAALSSKFGSLLQIVLIESDQIGTIGVGESTIPPLRAYHQVLGISEQEFMRATSATFKLGVAFEGWGKKDSQYIHSFGLTGQESWVAGFQNLWLRAREEGVASEFGDYCYELNAAKQNKFALNKNETIHYAYQLDATRYAQFLRSISLKQGVTRQEGKIVEVQQDKSTGHITNVVLESGQTIAGDLFIDCTGFRGLLIEQTLNTGYEDWSHWLPCDRAIAAQTASTGPAIPYTKAIAHDAGWRWRIPLQHRIGNGLVYSSKFLSDDEAQQRFLDSIEGKPLNDPMLIPYKTGRRLKFWNKNCVALGLSSGFVEPLESTGIHMFMAGIIRLMQLFPFGGISPAIVNEYNMQSRKEIEHIRDFIILHYHINQRDDSQFWRLCQNMDIPDSLQNKINLFKETARIFKEDSDPFRVDSWTQVMIGQGLLPERYHHVTKIMSSQELKNYMQSIKTTIDQKVSRLPTHEDFIKQYCKAEMM